MPPTVIDEQIAGFTLSEGKTARIYATARRDGIIWQGGIYSVINDQRSETQWVAAAYGSNPQKAMAAATRHVFVTRQADHIEILEY